MFVVAGLDLEGLNACVIKLRAEMVEDDAISKLTRNCFNEAWLYAGNCETFLIRLKLYSTKRYSMLM